MFNKGITIKLEPSADLKESALKAVWYDGARTGFVSAVLLALVLYVLFVRAK